jgi:WD40 repeat protein
MRRFRLLQFVAIAFCVWLASTVAVLACLPCVPRFTLRGTEGSDRSELLNFSPDGQTVAVSNPGTDEIQLFDVDSGRELLCFPIVPKRPWPDKVVFSPDGHLTAFRTRGSLIIWHIASGKQVGEIEGQIIGPVFSPDGRLLAARILPENALKLWDFVSGQELGMLPATRGLWGNPDNYKFTPDGEAILFEQGEGVALWSIRNFRQRAMLKGRIDSLAFCSDEPILSLCDNGAIRLYDITTGKARTCLPADHCRFGEVVFCSRGRLAAIQCPDPDFEHTTIRMYKAATGTVTAILDPQVSPDAMDGNFMVSRDGRLLLWRGISRGGFEQGDWVVWDIGAEQPRELYRLPYGHRREFALDHRMAVIHYWDMKDTRMDSLRRWFGRRAGFHLPEPRSRLQFVDLISTEMVATLDIPKRQPNENGAFNWGLSPDGRTLAVEEEKGGIVLWDAPPRKPTAFAATLALVPVAFLVLIRSGRRVRKRPPTAVAGVSAAGSAENVPCG